MLLILVLIFPFPLVCVLFVSPSVSFGLASGLDAEERREVLTVYVSGFEEVIGDDYTRGVEKKMKLRSKW